MCTCLVFKTCPNSYPWRVSGPGSALRPAPLPPSITEEPSSQSSPDPTPSLNATQVLACSSLILFADSSAQNVRKIWWITM